MTDELIRYCKPKGPLPDLAGSRSGAILIIGSASCVETDLARYDHIHIGERMAVNDAVPWYKGRLDHAASLHPAKLWFWINDRARQPKFVHSSHRAGGFPETLWPLHADGATSGLFAVVISLLMGFDRIVLAGIPVSDEPKVTGQTGLISSDVMQGEWMIFSRFFEGKVKSLSGWTMDQFGSPI